MAGRIRDLIVAGFFLACGQAFIEAADAVPREKVSFYVAGQKPYKGIHFGVFNSRGEITSSVELDFKTSGRSDRFEYHGPLPIVFFEERPSTNPDDPNAVKRTEVARVSPGGDSEELLILFRNDRQGIPQGSKYVATAVEIDSRSLPSQHLTVLNLTGVRLQGALKIQGGSGTSADTFSISPGINAPMQLGSSSTFIIALETNRSGWIKAFEDRFICRENEKYILIVYPPRVRGSIILGGSVITFKDEILTDEDPNP